MRTFLVFVAAAFVFLAGAWMHGQYDSNPSPANPEQYTTQPAEPSDGSSKGEAPAPCKYEDGSNSPNPCYWDGGSNGKGRSYVIENGTATDVDTGETFKID